MLCLGLRRQMQTDDGCRFEQIVQWRVAHAESRVGGLISAVTGVIQDASSKADKPLGHRSRSSAEPDQSDGLTGRLSQVGLIGAEETYRWKAPERVVSWA
jgi:hypothetical protein